MEFEFEIELPLAKVGFPVARGFAEVKTGLPEVDRGFPEVGLGLELELEREVLMALSEKERGLLGVAVLNPEIGL